MRLRNVKGAREEMLVNRFVVQQPAQYKGKWKEFFGNENPIYIEVGMGKGKFLLEHAKTNPNINYIGLEKFDIIKFGVYFDYDIKNKSNITLFCAACRMWRVRCKI